MVQCVVIAMWAKQFGIERTRFESALDPKRVILCVGVLKIDTPGLKKHLASWPDRRYNTPNLNMRESPSNQVTAVLLHLVKKGSLTTCKTTDSVGAHGNSGNKSVKK